MSRRSMLRTSIKRVIEAIQLGDSSSAATVYVSACSTLDKAVKSGLIHKNKAARHKSNLTKKLKAIGADAPVKSDAVKAVKKEVKKPTPSVKKEAKPKSSKVEKKESGDKKPSAKSKSKKSED
jgi:small subunit ribosomal protein S20